MKIYIFNTKKFQADVIKIQNSIEFFKFCYCREYLLDQFPEGLLLGWRHIFIYIFAGRN
jgi:hypothetical protein